MRGNYNIVETSDVPSDRDEASGILHHRRGSNAIVIGAIQVFAYVSPVKHGERLADAVELAQENTHVIIRNSEAGPRNSPFTTIALSSKISKDP